MIVFEYYMTRADGTELWRTYSDQGFYIERDGVRYTEAIDPVSMGRIYTETVDRIEQEETDAPEPEKKDKGEEEKKKDGAAE